MHMHMHMHVHVRTHEYSCTDAYAHVHIRPYTNAKAFACTFAPSVERGIDAGVEYVDTYLYLYLQL